MGGLRRLTLNDNTQIGNNGSKLLCEALREDKWVKAIDMQNCGLGDAAGQAWLNLLRAPLSKSTGRVSSLDALGNRTLGIVDLRRNKKMGKANLRTELLHQESHMAASVHGSAHTPPHLTSPFCRDVILSPLLWHKMAEMLSWLFLHLFFKGHAIKKEEGRGLCGSTFTPHTLNMQTNREK